MEVAKIEQVASFLVSRGFRAKVWNGSRIYIYHKTQSCGYLQMRKDGSFGHKNVSSKFQAIHNELNEIGIVSQNF